MNCSIGTASLGSETRRMLNQYMDTVDPVTAVLGPVVERDDIKSSLGSFLFLPECKIHYPEVVVQALGALYAEYNKAFGPLVDANREWDTDYRFCLATDDTPVNGWVQIDMVGLPERFLSAASHMPQEEVCEILRGGIFEIENSLAMYQMLEKIFSSCGEASLFRSRFRASLDEVKRKHGRPVALLAVTDEKHQVMRASEFGKNGEPLSDDEVIEMSGFDRFFGPAEFLQYLRAHNGNCEYLLYVRSSDPVAKLRRPSHKVDHPLLGDPATRRVIKAHALTFNVDAPEMDFSRRINDTKEYMSSMGMAFPVCCLADVLSSGFMSHLAQGGAHDGFADARLTVEFADYLTAQGIDAGKVASGAAALRAKPMKCTYGCYGHLTGRITQGRKFRSELSRAIRSRGPYVVQPEMPVPTVINKTDGHQYTYIDRNFFSTDGEKYRFLGGFRSLMPCDSQEAKQGRNHGNGSTVWAEIC